MVLEKKKFWHRLLVLFNVLLNILLNFFKNYQLDVYKMNVLTYVLNFKLFNYTAYLSTKVSANMSIFFYQLSSLIRKNIVVFDRIFFVELIFKRWLMVSFSFFLLLLFFI